MKHKCAVSSNRLTLCTFSVLVRHHLDRVFSPLAIFERQAFITDRAVLIQLLPRVLTFCSREKVTIPRAELVGIAMPSASCLEILRCAAFIRLPLRIVLAKCSLSLWHPTLLLRDRANTDLVTIHGPASPCRDGQLAMRPRLVWAQ